MRLTLFNSWGFENCDGRRRTNGGMKTIGLYIKTGRNCMDFNVQFSNSTGNAARGHQLTPAQVNAHLTLYSGLKLNPDQIQKLSLSAGATKEISQEARKVESLLIIIDHNSMVDLHLMTEPVTPVLIHQTEPMTPMLIHQTEPMTPVLIHQSR